MSENTVKLVTIITEAALETQLVREVEEHGARGYTLTNARGKGSRGSRSASWEANANIRLEVICGERLAETIVKHVNEKYFEHYAMVIFTSDIEVLRPEKYKTP